MRLGTTKFIGQDERNHYRGGLNDEGIVKLVAKMFRELTHEKPPRGRMGRHLDQDQHYCVMMREGRSRSYYHSNGVTDVIQGQYTPDDELLLIERRNVSPSYVARYQTTLTDNEDDIKNLLQLNEKYMKKQALTGAVSNLSELMSGLMGYGIAKVEYEEIGYRGGSYRASFMLDGKFRVVIEETT